MRDRTRAATGVIDTLSLGYATVNRHPWIIAIPVLLDFLYWLGPRLSVATLLRTLLEQVPMPAGLSDEMLQSYSSVQQSTLSAAEGFNLLSLLSTNFPGLPSVMAGRVGSGQAFELAAPVSAVVAFLLVGIAGTLLGAFFFTVVGLKASGESRGMVGAAWRSWLRLAALLLLGIVAALVVGAPLAGLAVIGMSLVPGAASIMASFVFVLVIWAEFYLFFVVQAVVISGAGPLRAIRNSFLVVRHNLGSSLGLIVLTWIISMGMPVVWDAMTDNPITAVLAILGNAYVATGLLAAGMLFYRERFGALGAGVRAQG